MFQRARKKLEEEIGLLDQELRVELPKEIGRAAALGDLRENAEYQTALERQRFVQARLGQLRKMLIEISSANLNNLPRDQAGLGSKVGLVDLDTGKKVSYEIVLSEEADYPKGRITIGSPIGQALLGKKVGDEVVIHAPSGTRTCELEDLRTAHDRSMNT